MFNKEVYINRRQILRQKMGSGICLILGNEESSMNYLDNTYPYRQDSTFLYYFGLKKVGAMGVLDIDENKDYLFGAELTIDDIIWSGPQATFGEQASSVGVKNIKSLSEGAQFIEENVKKGRMIHFLPPYRPEHQLKLHRLLGMDLGNIDKNISRELVEAVIEQRSIKSDEEIAEMHKATLVTCDMHIAAMKNAREGMVESELTGIVNGVAVGGGGNLSFPIILSMDGQILHNHSHHNILKKGRLVICDSGAEVASGYAGDMTRTFPVGSSFSQKQKDVYEIVLASQLAAIDSLKPGITYKEIHLRSAGVIAEGLVNLGLLKGSVTDIVEKGAHALFFPHGLGHMIGLDVHDMENLGENFVGYDQTIKRSEQFGLRSLRLGKKLEKGYALTVEPGIYFIPELIAQWENEGKHKELINYNLLHEYLDFGGIRIEDDYVITNEGGQLLGKEVPKTVKDVEELRREGLGE